MDPPVLDFWHQDAQWRTSIVFEAWIEWAVVFLIFVLRLFSRTLLRKRFRNLQLDDALMMLALITYTVMIAAINRVAKRGTTMLSPLEAARVDGMPPEVLFERQRGGQMVILVEGTILLSVWLCKLCLLILYERLTLRSKCNQVVKALLIYVSASFVIILVLYLTVWCRPFTDYWSVTTLNEQCNKQTNHLVTFAVFNVTSDIMIVLIPTRAIVNAQIKLRRKMLLLGLFLLAMFTIVSAIISKIYRHRHPDGTNWTVWYLREATIAMIVSNIPCIWHLIERTWTHTAKKFGPKDAQAALTAKYPGHTQVNGCSNPCHMHLDSERVSTQQMDRPKQKDEDEIHIPLQIWTEVEFKVESESMITEGDEAGSTTIISNGHLPGAAGRPNLDDPDIILPAPCHLEY